MENKGIMADIRELLAQGRSSGEVVAEGFAASTVYKVQRQLRKKPLHQGKELVRVAAQTHPAPAGPEEQEPWPSVDDLFEEDAPLALLDLLDRGFPELSERVEALSTSLDQASSEREAYRLRVRDLETKVVVLLEQHGKIEALGRQVERCLRELEGLKVRVEQRAEAADRKLGVLSDLVGPLLVMVLHADGHQRREDMNYRSLYEVVGSPPKWTLWRSEEVYAEARQELLAFLKSLPERYAPLPTGLPGLAPGTTRAIRVVRG